MKQIRDFIELHPASAEPFRHWRNAVEQSEWRNPAELRATLGSADFFRDLTIFDIGGNKYRLIAYVHYRRQIVFIKSILTHKEYDGEKWKP